MVLKAFNNFPGSLEVRPVRCSEEKQSGYYSIIYIYTIVNEHMNSDEISLEKKAETVENQCGVQIHINTQTQAQTHTNISTQTQT